jgi:hypothetical protein
MGFFRSLQETAPRYDPQLPWPLDGLASVIMFFGPLSGGAASGLIAAGVVGLLLGLVVGGFICTANAVAFDCFVERLLARLQHFSRRLSGRVVMNLIGFAWAIAVCAASVWLSVSLADRLGIITWSV